MNDISPCGEGISGVMNSFMDEVIMQSHVLIKNIDKVMCCQENAKRCNDDDLRELVDNVRASISKFQDMALKYDADMWTADRWAKERNGMGNREDFIAKQLIKSWTEYTWSINYRYEDFYINISERDTEYKWLIIYGGTTKAEGLSENIKNAAYAVASAIVREQEK